MVPDISLGLQMIPLGDYTSLFHVIFHNGHIAYYKLCTHSVLYK
jgi:hypothetical protein